MATWVTSAASSGLVPVVGCILADATETVLAGAGIIRNAVGVFGALAVLAFCLVPFLTLGLHYLAYKAAAVLASTMAKGRIGGMIGSIRGAFGLVLGIAGASALLLLIPMGRKHPGLLSSALWRDVARMAASALVMGAAALLVRWGLSLVLSGEGLLDRLLLAGVPALAGAAVYFPSAWLLRVPEMKQAAAMIQKILHRGGN